MARQTHQKQPRHAGQQADAFKTDLPRRLDSRSVESVDQASLDQREYMDPKRAAEYLGGLSTSFLAKLRMVENRHRGPAFVKIGRVVFYRKADLDRWVSSRVVEAA
jgi:hypothetical protein